MSHEELIKVNAYNDALLAVLERVIDKRDYKTRRAILNLWKDGALIEVIDVNPTVTYNITIHDQVTV